MNDKNLQTQNYLFWGVVAGMQLRVSVRRMTYVLIRDSQPLTGTHDPEPVVLSL